MPFNLVFEPTQQGLDLGRLEIWEDDLWICDLVVDAPNFSSREVYIRRALSWLMEVAAPYPTASGDRQDVQRGDGRSPDRRDRGDQ